MIQLLTGGPFPDVHVLPLLGPLHPHADAVLEEGRDEAEAGEVRQDMFPVPRDLEEWSRLIKEWKEQKNFLYSYDPLVKVVDTCGT